MSKCFGAPPARVPSAACTLLAVVGLFSVLAPALAGAPAAVRPARVLLAGPQRVPEPAFAKAAGAQDVAFVPEIDPASAWPADGTAVDVGPGVRFAFAPAAAPGTESGASGAIPLPAGEGVAWVASYVDADRFGEVGVAVTAPGALRLWIDGAEAGTAGAPGDAESVVKADRKWGRGLHRLLIRCTRTPAPDAAAPALLLEVTPKDETQRIDFAVDPAHPPADYAELREQGSITGVTLSPDGALVACVSKPYGPHDAVRARLQIVEVATGHVRAADLGAGATPRPIAWSRDGAALFAAAGGGLVRWTRATGAIETVLADEPGLGDVAIAPDASFVVFASTRGAAEPESEGPRRRVDLREKLSDWPTRPHLHLLSLTSGARRRLLAPGDFCQDAFAIHPDGATLVYLRNVPRASRPWFETEVRTLDLAGGEDRLVSTLVMGFENRPGLGGFALAPDGARIAFVGPPAELGERLAGPEPNAFDPDLWLLELDGGTLTCLTAEHDAAVGGDLAFSADGATLLFTGTEGSRVRIHRARLPAEPGAAPVIEALPIALDVTQSLSASADLSRVAFVGHDLAWLPALFVRETARPLEGGPLLDPNGALRTRWQLATATAVEAEAADGTKLDAWLHLPAGARALRRDASDVPWLVYFYGGATPTVRGFNELHQFLVAQGYPLLVVNPRGAAGYGRAFSDHHPNDWGPKSGADILAAVDACLERHPFLSRERIGCFGGSYGGFMTMWLVANSDRFAAAVSLYGISDVASYFGEGTWGYTYGDQAFAKTYPWSDPQWFAEHSPLFRADRVRTPLLLMHGEKDENVPPGESEQMFTALKLLGRDAELVLFPGEDHGLRGSWENRIAHRTMLAEWFDRWLRGQGEAWEERWKD